MKKNISRANLASPSSAHRLVFIDGNAILHRAYHALPPLTTPDGTMVNAVYGFTSMILKIFHEFAPTHMAVAFDRPEPTFRKTLYKEYQATRPKMEDDLASQVPLVHDVVTAFGIPIFEAAGFEADDVIGSIAAQAQSAKRKVESGKIDEVIIVTGDRDILQLVDDRKGIKVFMPTKGLSKGKLYGEKDVEEKMGVAPKQMPDLKALTGDASDNYPGVAGVGPKTAAKLITTYGSIEALYRSDAVTEKLREGEENAKLSKDLAAIRTDAPVEVGELVAITTLDTPQAREKLTELHFPSLIKRLGAMKESKDKKEKKVAKKASEQQQLF